MFDRYGKISDGVPKYKSYRSNISFFVGSLHYFSNISKYFLPSNKIKDIFKISMNRAVEKHPNFDQMAEIFFRIVIC